MNPDNIVTTHPLQSEITRLTSSSEKYVEESMNESNLSSESSVSEVRRIHNLIPLSLQWGQAKVFESARYYLEDATPLEKHVVVRVPYTGDKNALELLRAATDLVSGVNPPHIRQSYLELHVPMEGKRGKDKESEKIFSERFSKAFTTVSHEVEKVNAKVSEANDEINDNISEFIRRRLHMAKLRLKVVEIVSEGKSD